MQAIRLCRDCGAPLEKSQQRCPPCRVTHKKKYFAEWRVQKHMTPMTEIRRTKVERSMALADLYRTGKTLQEIATQLGITRERVRQLITPFVTKARGGKALTARTKRTQRAAAKDAVYLARFGCSYAQYRALFSVENSPTRAFVQQRSSAYRRGIGWQLNLWQWWTLWQESGKWSQRGRGYGYVMARLGDEGPYAIGNVKIITQAENAAEQYVNHPEYRIRAQLSRSQSTSPLFPDA